MSIGAAEPRIEWVELAVMKSTQKREWQQDRMELGGKQNMTVSKK